MHECFATSESKTRKYTHLYIVKKVPFVCHTVVLHVQYNLSTPALVYSGFLSNPAKIYGPNNFPIHLNVKNTCVIRIL